MKMALTGVFLLVAVAGVNAQDRMGTGRGNAAASIRETSAANVKLVDTDAAAANDSAEIAAEPSAAITAGNWALASSTTTFVRLRLTPVYWD